MGVIETQNIHTFILLIKIRNNSYKIFWIWVDTKNISSAFVLLFMLSIIYVVPAFYKKEKTLLENFTKFT